MASQKVFGSYQEIIDLHTEANHVSAIGIHTPTGDTPRKMFKGYFDQYKKYKYLGASITLVPAARLPADPMGVSYNSTGQVEGTSMDPRDALNPIMFHGCHGDDMGAILNTLYGNNSSISDSVDGLDGGAVSITDFVGASLWVNMERLYYKALTDKTWKKANPMSGFKKGNLRPLVYSLATNRQIMPYEDSPAGLNALTEGGDPTTEFVEDEDTGLFAPKRQNNLQFFTPRLTRLGWMETRNVHAVAKPGIEGIDSADDIPQAIAQMLDTTTTPAEMPKIYMGIILMAPAYGVEQYYRMIVNHRFAFKEFRGISFMPATDGVPAYTNANPDLFNGEQYEDWNAVESGGSGGSSAHPVKVYLRVSDEVISSLLTNVNYRLEFHLEVNNIQDENEWYRYDDFVLRRLNTTQVGVALAGSSSVAYETWVADGNYSPVLASPEYVVNFSTPVASGGLDGTFGWSPSVGQVTDNPNQEITFTLVKVTS